MAADSLRLAPIPDIPLIRPGDDLAQILGDALAASSLTPRDMDVLVVAQKIVSKAENRYVDLRGVTPKPRAEEIARATSKDPRLVELILSESAEVVRHAKDVLIVAHRLGFVMANAGVDQSNVEPDGPAERVLLLPADPDASCARLKARLEQRFGMTIAVIINDSFGRAWRNGTVGVALGAAGLPALADLRGRPDLFGRRLQVTQVGFADEIAAAASLVMGQADEGRPAVLVRGLEWTAPPLPAAALLRPKNQDLFR
ncbi:MAG: coenzyme F420-0:L-glutamate ligase [Proteobacteria bacterium]|nr:coenzyme F420-0:L-glutamate ligase [Pseudomonadota bacterium]